MRLFAHIIAVFLAVSLVAKPCLTMFASGTEAAGGPTVEAPRSTCKAKCLSARLEDLAEPQANFARKPGGAGSDHPAEVKLIAWDTRSYAKPVAGPWHGFTRSSRQLLCELCRRLI